MIPFLNAVIESNLRDLRAADALVDKHCTGDCDGMCTAHLTMITLHDHGVALRDLRDGAVAEAQMAMAAEPALAEVGA